MRTETEHSIVVSAWKGLAPDALNPPGESCRAGKNFVLDEVAGELTLRKGTADLFPILQMPEPWTSYLVPGYGGDVEGNPYKAMDRRTKNNGTAGGELVALEGFWTPAQGGQFIRTAVVKYRVRALTTAEPWVYTYGVFIRPYWDGAAWVNLWRELTEIWDFEVYNVDGAGAAQLVILDEGAWNVGDNQGSPVFPTWTANGGTGLENRYYFRGWLAENITAGRELKRFARVLETKLLGDSFALSLPADGSSGTGAFDRLEWQIGDVVRLHRNYVYKGNRFSGANDVVVSPTIYPVDGGLRISNGRGTNKARFRINYHERGLTSTITKEHHVNGMVMADQCVDGIPVGFFVAAEEDTGSGTLPAGVYYLRFAVREGQNWSKLFVCPTLAGGDWTVGTGSVTLPGPGNGHIKLHPILIPAAVSRQLEAFRIYISGDNQNFYRMQEYEINAIPGLQTTEQLQADYDDGTDTHLVFGIAGEFSLGGTEYDNPGPEASLDIGRGKDDAGTFYYVVGTPVDNRVLYGDVEVGGVGHTNRVYRSGVSGDGSQQLDVVPNNAEHYITIGEAGGAYVRGIAALPDRALILTDGMAKLLTMLGGVANWTINLVTTDDGLVARNGLLVVDGRVYWPGSYGVWTYAAHEGRRLLNPDWMQTYEALGNKHLATAGFDKIHGRYVLHIGGSTYVFPARSADVAVKEAMPFVLSKTPLWISKQPEIILTYVTADNLLARFDFTSAGAEATRDYGGVQITAEFETNDFLLPGDPTRTDMLVHGFQLDFVSSIPVTVQVYRDGVLFDTKVLPAGAGSDYRALKLGCAAKRVRFKFAATTTDDGQTVRIQKLFVKRTLQEAGGDRPWSV